MGRALNGTLVLVVLEVVGCGPGAAGGGVHHECPNVTTAASCTTVEPAGFDPAAECAARKAGSVPSLWTGRMCSGDGCMVEGYPPAGASFELWMLCDGVPVEVWCK